MLTVILHPPNTATASAGRPPNGVIPDLCRDDLLLDASQQPSLACSVAQVGDIGEITGPFDLRVVSGLSLTFSIDFHQPQNLGHASVHSRAKNRRENPRRRLHPKTCRSPAMACSAPLIAHASTPW